MVAIKAESCVSSKQVLKMEVAVLKRLQTSTHFCKFLACGRNEKVNYVVMTLLGPSLSELRKKQPSQKFSLSTMLRIGIQVVEAVRAIHNCGFLHRDVKPSNFAIGASSYTSRICYMLDFGLARQYTTPTGEIRQPRPSAGFRGTVRYASISAHMSRELGRHDDLWSVFYMLVELSRGQLPWRKLREKEEAGTLKAKYDHKQLVQGLPNEFRLFLGYLQTLTYFEKPHYSYITDLLTKALKHIGALDSDPYDWEQDVSAPSLTTASGGSPPAIGKVTPPGSVKSGTKTNCSVVEDLNSQHSIGILKNREFLVTGHHGTGEISDENRHAHSNNKSSKPLDIPSCSENVENIMGKGTSKTQEVSKLFLNKKPSSQSDKNLAECIEKHTVSKHSSVASNSDGREHSSSVEQEVGIVQQMSVHAVLPKTNRKLPSLPLNSRTAETENCHTAYKLSQQEEWKVPQLGGGVGVSDYTDVFNLPLPSPTKTPVKDPTTALYSEQFIPKPPSDTPPPDYVCVSVRRRRYVRAI